MKLKKAWAMLKEEEKLGIFESDRFSIEIDEKRRINLFRRGIGFEDVFENAQGGKYENR